MEMNDVNGPTKKNIEPRGGDKSLICSGSFFFVSFTSMNKTLLVFRHLTLTIKLCEASFCFIRLTNDEQFEFSKEKKLCNGEN